MSASLMNRETLTKQLQGLIGTQQGIEAVAKWCVFFFKEAKAIAVVWEEEFTRSNAEKKLVLLYLANHTIQEGRKKGREFVDEYVKVLPKAMASLSKQGDKKCREAMLRMISIWDERRIFSTSQTKSMKDAIAAGARSATGTPAAAGEANGGSNPDDMRKLKAVGSLAPVMLDVSITSTKSSEWMSKRNALSSDLAQNGQHVDVAAGLGTVSSTLAALQAEVHARKKASTFLKIHLSQQEDSLKKTEDQVANLSALQKQLEQRVKTLGPLASRRSSEIAPEQKASAGSVAVVGATPMQGVQPQALISPRQQPQQQQQQQQLLAQQQQHQSLSQMFPAGFEATMAAMQGSAMPPFPPQLPPGMLMQNFNMWGGPGSGMGPPHLPPGMMGLPPGMPMAPFPQGIDLAAQLNALTAAMAGNPGVIPGFGPMPPQQQHLPPPQPPQHPPQHPQQQPHHHQQQQQQHSHQVHPSVQQQQSLQQPSEQAQDLQTQLLQQLSAGLGGMLPNGSSSSLDIDKLASVLANSDQGNMMLASALAAAPQAEQDQFGMMANGSSSSEPILDAAAQQQLLAQLMAMSDGGAGILAGAMNLAASAASADNGDGSMMASDGMGQQQQGLDFFQQGGSDEAEAPYDPEYPD